jgi:hypothetical protein
VERAAVAAVESSLLRLTDLSLAMPLVDHGIDLIAFRPRPFATAGVQVKGAVSGLTVYSKYVAEPVLISYVLKPLSPAPEVFILTGADAWDLPNEYQRRGGRASDHHESNVSYRWNSVTSLLREILDEYQATEERWASLFEQVRAR